jgi:hypothetical protein
VLISLTVTEDVDADYATAAAVCLAPGGPHSTGEVVQTVEAGVSTGYWVVEDPVTLKSGQKTWRRWNGADFAHMPWVTYKLRRKGYHQARGTLGKVNTGSDDSPPKYWSVDHERRMNAALFAAVAKGDWAGPAGAQSPMWAAQNAMKGHRTASTGDDVIRHMCSLMGITATIMAKSPTMVEEYIPIGKPLMTAVKEVASWSGNSVYLGRNGDLVVYNFATEYASGSPPHPGIVLEEEHHDALYPYTFVTVIGEHRSWDNVMVITPGPFFPVTTLETREVTVPVEWSEGIAATPGTKHIEERLEVREYSLTPAMAQKIARERLMRAALGAGTIVRRGYADGCQSIQPVYSKCFSVTRNLEQSEGKFSYTIDITAPYAGMQWNTPLAPADSWT